MTCFEGENRIWRIQTLWRDRTAPEAMRARSGAVSSPPTALGDQARNSGSQSRTDTRIRMSSRGGDRKTSTRGQPSVTATGEIHALVPGGLHYRQPDKKFLHGVRPRSAVHADPAASSRPYA
jgi:hypothetical protein